MKPGVVIINTARGAVMDEAALVQALDEGIVGSVGLDVYEEEPKIHPGLVRNEKVMLLPHMGTASYEASGHEKRQRSIRRLTGARHNPQWKNGTSQMSRWP